MSGKSAGSRSRWWKYDALSCSASATSAASSPPSTSRRRSKVRAKPMDAERGQRPLHPVQLHADHRAVALEILPTQRVGERHPAGPRGSRSTTAIRASRMTRWKSHRVWSPSKRTASITVSERRRGPPCRTWRRRRSGRRRPRASASGNVSHTGTRRRPAASSGSTWAATSAATSAFSRRLRMRRVEPPMRTRFS